VIFSRGGVEENEMRAANGRTVPVERGAALAGLGYDGAFADPDWC